MEGSSDLRAERPTSRPSRSKGPKKFIPPFSYQEAEAARVEAARLEAAKEDQRRGESVESGMHFAKGEKLDLKELFPDNLGSDEVLEALEGDEGGDGGGGESGFPVSRLAEVNILDGDDENEGLKMPGTNKANDQEGENFLITKFDASLPSGGNGEEEVLGALEGDDGEDGEDLRMAA
jgi:hypothetical protein